MPSYKLFYFDSRGRAELLRILFQLAGQEFEDVRISVADWPTIKPTTPFGQLPYLEIDGKPYTQCAALASFLASQFGYYGETNIDKLKIDQVIGLVYELIQEIFKFYEEQDEAKKAELMKNFGEVVAPKYFGLFEGLLKKNGTGFFVGKSVTLADLTAYDIVHGIRARRPQGLLDNFPLIAALYEKIENLDNLKSYLATRKVTDA